MDVSSIESDVCKTVTSLGFSKDRTHAIINGLHRTLHNNGPEWMVVDLIVFVTTMLTPETLCSRPGLQNNVVLTGF
jgi:hypothetical protein